MRLIITRHRETEENKKGILQGHLQGVLSSLGKEQAKKLADRLKDEKIDLIISSDLDRALDTAKTTVKFHPDARLVTNRKLRERSLGDFQGKTKAEFIIPENMSRSDYFNSGNAENDEQVFERAKDLLKEILKQPEESILLVGHNRICKSIIGNLKDVEDQRNLKDLDNVSISEYSFDGKEWEEIKFNCTRHLK
jgi:broad specificity phosphatase PhoE